MLMCKLGRRAVVLACIAGVAPEASAASYAWINASGGAWSAAGNWSPAGGPPTAGDIATFNLNAAYPVSIGVNTADRINIGGGTVTFRRVGTGLLALTSGQGNVFVTNNARLFLGEAGAPVTLVANDIFRIVTGAEATIRTGSSASVHRLQLGTSGGGTTSRLTVTGAGARLEAGHSSTSSPASTIGQSGAHGVLDLTQGGRATFAGPLILTDSFVSNSRSTIRVFGGSTLTTGDLAVGNTSSALATGQSAALLAQSSGAVVNQTGAASLTIGSALNSNIDAHVSLSGGGIFNSGTGQILVQNSGRLNVGVNGRFNANGALLIDRGGTAGAAGSGALLRVGESASAPPAFIGLNAGSSSFSVSFGGEAVFNVPLHLSRTVETDAHSRVDVLADSSLTLSDLSIGNHPLSMNFIQNFASVNVTGSGAIATQAGAASLILGGPSPFGSGVLNVNGGGIFTSGTEPIQVVNNGFINVGAGGTFNANANVDVASGRVQVHEQGRFNVASGRVVTVRDFGLFTATRHTICEDTAIQVVNGGSASFPGIFQITSGAVGPGLPERPGDGHLLVDGPGSIVTAPGLALVGGHPSHSATLTLRNGAAMSTGDLNMSTFLAFLAVTAGGDADVQILSGSSMTTNGNVGMAFADVLAGDPTTAASLTVDGAGSTFTQTGNNSILLGHASHGSAVINVRNDARFTSGTGSIDIRGTGRINLSSGGVFHARGPINMDGGQFNFSGGTLRVPQFNGHLVNHGGTLAPSGLTTITGNYTQLPGATLEIELGGFAPGVGHDRLVVGGHLNAAGTLAVRLRGSFIPLPGDLFEVVAFGSRGGDVTIANRTGFAGLMFQKLYAPNSLTLRATAHPGDANLDGVVNLLDFNRLAANFGASGANWLMADFNGDGLVNLADFNILAANFGLSAGPGGPTPDDWAALGAAVPEPVAASFVAGALAVLRRRRHGAGAAIAR